jgi:hypothetical protein
MFGLVADPWGWHRGRTEVFKHHQKSTLFYLVSCLPVTSSVAVTSKRFKKGECDLGASLRAWSYDREKRQTGLGLQFDRFMDLVDELLGD